MSKLKGKVEHYIAASKELGLNISDDLIGKITEDLVPAIYSHDSETVACSDSSELQTVKKNFIENKLGVTEDEAKLDATIKEVCEAMGTSNTHKYRVLFYALLTKKLGKESVYA